MVGSFAPQPPEFSVSGHGTVPRPFHLITNAAALRLGHFLRHSFLTHRHHLRSILQSPVTIPHLGHVYRLNGVPYEGSHQFEWFKLGQWPHDAWATTFSRCLLLFSGEENKTNYGDQGNAYLRAPTRGPVNNRRLTNILLAINVLVYVAQIASRGQVLMWGAKINSLIDKGELWRLVTSAFLHANVGHLMINCYSLNSIGPTMEHLSGPRRYLAIYMTSAVTSSAMSYWFSKAPAVGASGAIFGLVGSFAIFVLRHNKMVKGGVGDLNHVARVIALNMAIGLLSQGIDNWGHLGGLMGGIATSWLIGPAWEVKSTTRLGRKVLVDKAPIFSLPGTKRASH
ncbi:putative rhomboid protease [Helianthus annuus]|uniref:Rhomboid protease n=1 Tax=Helianthus annuus TaxID=4232 RepID=A0A9K3N4F2_HELAN|nr:RHOMBOID-like protein 10, chloroplastic [Helianthus annuus]KAF5786604.1 putative rhomboid protease [Helianthus annuus]KAJ0513986.1 putative rhomboid protease [Helianthus annuus]KAJ0522000.1 putative rhomboid protease [Helianthus annuus]KAJ0530115.1 putative rhomboid protease [Helianthus annuus]KAJ0696970.1 putative rhomboid protease [Helianthus annuus]